MENTADNENVPLVICDDEYHDNYDNGLGQTIFVAKKYLYKSELD